MRVNGSKNLVGRAGVVEQSCQAIFPDLFIRVPIDQTKILPRFFVAWWNSPQMRERIEVAAKTTAGIWKINQRHIASFSVPILPLDEQRRIIAYLDKVQARVDALQQLQEKSRAELDALLPSVLDKAFRGEL